MFYYYFFNYFIVIQVQLSAFTPCYSPPPQPPPCPPLVLSICPLQLFLKNYALMLFQLSGKFRDVQEVTIKIKQKLWQLNKEILEQSFRPSGYNSAHNLRWGDTSLAFTMYYPDTEFNNHPLFTDTKQLRRPSILLDTHATSLTIHLCKNR